MAADDVLESRRGQLADLCRRYAVQRLWLFGSAATGRFDPAKSDFDFVVEFGSPLGMGLAAQFFDFWEDLKKLLERDVDLVERCAIRNRVFLKSIERQERLVYAA